MATPTSSISKVDPVLIEVSAQNQQGAKKLDTLPTASGPATSSAVISNNAEKMSFHPVLPGVLAQLTNNASATFKMTKNGLKETGKAWVDCIQTGNSYLVLGRLIIATVSAALCGGSLLAGAAMKATLWLPVIGVTTAAGGIVGGLAGFSAFILSGLKTEEAKKWARNSFQFTTNVVGGSLASLDSVLVASLSIVVRGPIELLGMAGAASLHCMSPDKYQGNKLGAALYMTIDDSLGLWTEYNQSFWWCPSKIEIDLQKKLVGIWQEMGANVEAVDPIRENYTITYFGREVVDGVLSEDLIGKIYGPKNASEHVYKDSWGGCFFGVPG